MAKGKINLQANDGAVIGLVVPDGLVSGERQISLGSNLSGITAYHLLGGNLSVDNTVLTNGFGVYLYTGNTTTLPTINLGMDITSQWGNTADETYGYLIKIKSRSAAGDWTLVNSVRGSTKYISSNTTAVEGTDANMFTLSTVAGVTTLNIGTSTRTNTNGVTYVIEVHQTTHRKTGVTNQGKSFTEHYNPDTGFSINGYEGSGLAGHEIPHSLGRKLGFVTFKNLSVVENWIAQYEAATIGLFNLNNAFSANTIGITNFGENNVTSGIYTASNTSTNQYIMFGYRNSYFDESGKLIGNYEVGVYQGTGASGNTIKTKGKPLEVFIKRLDALGNWRTYDNQRPQTLFISTNSAELTEIIKPTFNINNFSLQDTSVEINALGGQYLYMVVYDNDNGSGKSKYYKATDTANVQINNGIIPLAHGIDSNGSKNSIVVANETITGLTYTEGKNYVYCKNDGTYGTTIHRPRYLSSDLIRTYAGESPDYYNVVSNKWYSCDAGSELVTNGTGLALTGWTGTSYNGTNTVTDASVLTLSNQAFVLLNATSKTYAGMIQAINGLTIGRKYKLVFDIASTSLGVNIYVKDTTFIGTTIAETHIYGQGNKQNYEFTATATTMYMGLVNFSTTVGHSSYIDNISVFASDIIPTTEITNSRNYMNHVVHADTDGGVLYVEELPKIEYKNVIKADEYLGKNACTLLATIDCTTTPPKILESYGKNISIIRTATGKYDLYTDGFDTLNAQCFVNISSLVTPNANTNIIVQASYNKFYIEHVENGVPQNGVKMYIHIDGGKN